MSYETMTDADFERIARETAERDKIEPRVVAASFDAVAGTLLLQFRDGQVVSTPMRALPGLAEATGEELAEVRPQSNGSSLHWDTLDVQYSTIALLQLIFKLPSQTEAGRKGGQTKTMAKSAAARANGAKGGRPRKVV